MVSGTGIGLQMLLQGMMSRGQQRAAEQAREDEQMHQREMTKQAQMFETQRTEDYWNRMEQQRKDALMREQQTAESTANMYRDLLGTPGQGEQVMTDPKTGAVYTPLSGMPAESTGVYDYLDPYAQSIYGALLNLDNPEAQTLGFQQFGNTLLQSGREGYEQDVMDNLLLGLPLSDAVQGLNTRQLSLLASLPDFALDRESFMTLEDQMRQSFQLDQDVFSMVGFLRTTGRESGDVVDWFKPYGVELTPEQVDTFYDVYRQMQAPRGGGGGGGGRGGSSGGAGGDYWQVYNSLGQNAQDFIQDYAINNGVDIPSIVGQGINQGIIRFDEFGNPYLNERGVNTLVGGFETESRPEATAIPEGELAFYSSMINNGEALGNIISSIAARGDLSEAQKANLISELQRIYGGRAEGEIWSGGAGPIPMSG